MIRLRVAKTIASYAIDPVERMEAEHLGPGFCLFRIRFTVIWKHS